jgi:hypothetical protein
MKNFFPKITFLLFLLFSLSHTVSFPSTLNQTAYGTEFILSLTQPSSLDQSALLLIITSADNSPLSGSWSFQNTFVEFQNDQGQATIPIPLNNSLSPINNGTFPIAIHVLTNVSSSLQMQLVNPSTPKDSEGTLVFPVSKFGTNYWVNIPSSINDQDEDQAFSIVTVANNTIGSK